MSRLFVVTASHLTSEDSVKYLEWMYESVIRASARDVAYLDVSFVTSVTASNEDLKKKLKTPSNCTLLRPKKDRLCQFDHFHIICASLKDIAKPDDYVMIMDDDDMMLEFPSCFGERDIFGGSQLLLAKCASDEVHKVSIDKLLELLPHQQGAEIVVDLSGHCMKMKHFEQYFRCNRPRLPIAAKHLEDVPFMEYLASLTGDAIQQRGMPLCWAPERPFIFHRLKEYYEWREETVKEIEKMVGALEVLNKENKKLEEELKKFTMQISSEKINEIKVGLEKLTIKKGKQTKEEKEEIMALLEQLRDKDESYARKVLEDELIKSIVDLGDIEALESVLSKEEFQLVRSILVIKGSSSTGSFTQDYMNFVKENENRKKEVEEALNLASARETEQSSSSRVDEEDKQLPSLVMINYDGMIRRAGVDSNEDV